MRDFTLDIYRTLLESLQKQGYELISYRDYMKTPPVSGWSDAPRCSCRSNCQAEAVFHPSREERKFVILRHDVDAKPENSLKTAQIEHSLGAKASYYFRTGESGCYRGSALSLPESVRAIAQLGHEIGYHYEDMSLCGGDFEKAYGHFQTWLDYFRQYYAVETVCMHGAPTSKWDSKDLWRKYDYKSLGLIGEPYMDTDFSDVFYLTDTGRCWDGYKVSVRDKIEGYQDQWTAQGLVWHTTEQLISAIENGQLPPHVMITTHPQRWTNSRLAWWEEMISQHIKNIIKRIIIHKK